MSSRTKATPREAVTGLFCVGTQISASVLYGTVTVRSILPSGRRCHSEHTLPRTVSIETLTWLSVAGDGSVSCVSFGTRLLTAAEGMNGRMRSDS